MKIKTVDGSYKTVRAMYTSILLERHPETWVAWADIKPILDEYIAAIENDQVGCPDYGLMK